MNERIQELAEQAEDLAFDEVDSGSEFHPAFCRILAESIVRECLGTLNHRYQWDGDVNDPQEIKKCIQRIQKHFGVEE